MVYRKYSLEYKVKSLKLFVPNICASRDVDPKYLSSDPDP